MAAIARGKEIMACGNAGSRRVVIGVAPVAEQVPTDRIIRSLKPAASDDSPSHVTARAARAVEKALRERAAQGAQSSRSRTGR
jgi:hypothetical protein